jgi:protease IV
MGKFIKGLFRIFSLIRRSITGLLFWGIAALIIYSIFYNDTPKVREGEVLVLAPSGNIVEEYSRPEFERELDAYLGRPPVETRLSDLQLALSMASRDGRILSAYLDLSGFASAGPEVLEELAGSLASFRRTGKPLYAYAPFLAQGGLYLASEADEIVLDPMGEVFLRGYGTYRSYMKEGLGKWGINPHIYRAGEHKDYVAPYLADSMDRRERESSALYLDDLWDSWKGAVTDNLGLDAGVLQTYSDNYGTILTGSGLTAAETAVHYGLADSLMTWDDYNQVMISRVGLDESGSGFSQTYWTDYLDRTEPSDLPVIPGKRIALLLLSGEIIWGEGSYDQIGSYQVEQTLDMIINDPSNAALVIRLDSPGGSAMGAEAIRRKLEKFHDYGIPLYVSMGNTGASGGYWIASEADEIWAGESTLTGSIGVFSYFFTVEDFLKEKAGVNVDGYGTTALSDVYRLDRNTSREADRMMQAGVDQTYRQFLKIVSRSRGIPLNELKPLAEGQVWTGRQALEKGLVDRVGGLEEMLSYAAEQAGMDGDFRVSDYDDNSLTGYRGMGGLIPLLGSSLISRFLPDTAKVVPVLPEDNPFGDPRRINAWSNL